MLAQNSFLKEWLDLCPQYLWELLEREANGMGVQCTGCSVHPGILHCTDCFSNLVWCQGCSVSSHRSLPFHRIQIWNGKCFVRSSLFKQGFVMHLGHHGESFPVQRNPLEYVSTPGAEAEEDEEEPCHQRWAEMCEVRILLSLLTALGVSITTSNGVLAQDLPLITSNFSDMVCFLPVSSDPRPCSHLMSWTTFTWMPWNTRQLV